MFCPKCGYPMTQSEPTSLEGSTSGLHEHAMNVWTCESARSGQPGATCERTVHYEPVKRPAMARVGE